VRGQDAGQDVPSGGRGPSYVSGAGGIGAGETVRESGGATGGSTGGSGSASGATGSTGSSTGGSDKPHGKNITEGGFDSDAPNASFNQDVGGKNDPARVALGRMEEADVPSTGGTGPRQGKVTGDGQFDGLGETSA